MKKIISILLSTIILLTTGTAYATETKSADISYNTLPVEFSDNLGTTENLDAMVDDGHLYVNAKQLGERLGYQVKAGDEYVAVFNKEFSNTVPYGITTFYYDSTKVGHMLFNKMVDYEAPFKTVKNADGEWIPFEFSLLLLNSSDVLLDKKIHVDMPEKNIVDIYMDVLKNNDRYLFDWEADAGATPGSMFAMGTAANMVQIFNGVLDWDGASWCQLINSFSMDSSSYDAKYSESFAKMFCTYSDEELSQDVDAMKEKLKPFNGDNWVVKSMKQIDDAYDYKIENLSKKTADLKKKMVVENKASVDAYNKSYQELDKLCSRADFFSETTDPFVQVSKSFKEATGFMEAFYSVMEITGYASEFQNQDKFAVKSLDTFIKNSNYGCVMSKAMKDGLRDYKNTLETDIVSYSAYNYLMNNMGDLLKEGLDVSTTLLDTESKIYLLIWDISKETVPWVKNGLSNTDCFLQSMYAGIVQSDTFKSYIDKRDAVFKDANNITSKNLYEVTQYCYAYLKSCYITRDAAVGALTEKTKKDNPTYESTQKMVNQEIAKCLVKLKDADKTNKYGCYGFLPENNKQYLSEYDDGELLKCVFSSVDGEELYKDVLDMYYYKIKNQNWTENDNVSILLSGNYSDYKSLSSVGYSLLDIDGNGIPELLIGDNDSQSDGVIIDLYTYVDDKVVYLDTTYERFGINLSKNGKIYRYGSGGAYNNFEEECKIDEKNKVLVPIESIVFDGYYNPNSPWYYATGNYYTDSYDYDLDKMKNISEEEAMNKRKEFENNITGYSITLFSDYIPQSDNDNISSNAGVYDEFLKNREYKNYIADYWTFGIPKQYSVMDIDGDGTDELLIYGSEDLWEDLAIFSFNSNTQQISLIPAMNYDSDEPQQISVLSAYGKIKYSEKYHAIVYSQYQNYSNGIACDSISYDVIKNGILDNDFIIGFGINSDTSEKEYYCGTENLTESEYNEYLAECSEISWMDLP
ncbi:hypothetical protein [Agathobacter rectalis]|uniref:VCBS repeat-containing protein n=1 Tax=Agathobacter rectalis TaxID=39491 RepID=A0A414A8D6_9FIRM|nr:hypothetical protein [Agathobacter rectalis]RGR63410.1 hypothetical protein DWY32_09885 [Agathobacter rectalis]RGS02106.1 hypothetical protein DWY15_09815 [Agathobacter rectalis]RHC42082.1 hypothetical protein DW848_01835 [Agathobacter rectalis]